MVKHVLSPLNMILHVHNPTQEQRLLQHARLLEIALEQNDTCEAAREFSLMMRLYHEIHRSQQVPPGPSPPFYRFSR